MKQKNEITIRAPFNRIFAAASDVARWPEFLPHYRYNRYLSHTPSGGVVKMSCVRSGIKATWTSQYRIDLEKRELHFRHLKSTWNVTRGMDVIWKFRELGDGSVHVSITHDIQRALPLAPRLMDWIVGRFFIHDIASKTLAGLKRKVEARSPLPVLTLPAADSPELAR
jgi:ribosome-associated toxin RatA of RatAB toxin-antitoxin module